MGFELCKPRQPPLGSQALPCVPAKGFKLCAVCEFGKPPVHSLNGPVEFAVSQQSLHFRGPHGETPGPLLLRFLRFGPGAQGGSMTR